MPESPFLPDGRQWIWNSSSLDPAICPRKYYYQIVRGLRSLRQSADLIFGGAYAKAHEQFHKTMAETGDREAALRSAVHRALTVTWFEDGPWQSTHPTKTRENLIRTIVWYYEHYNPDTCQTIILEDGKPAVELFVKFHLGGEIWISAHLDRLITYAGESFVQDQKTTRKTLGQHYYKQYNPNNQMSLYTLLAKVTWKVPVKGVMIDAAQILVGESRFDRGMTFRTDAQLEEWVKGIHFTIEEMWEAGRQGYPMKESACGLFGGCEYLDICSKDPSVREAYLAEGFAERRHSPLE